VASITFFPVAYRNSDPALELAVPTTNSEDL